APTPPTPSTTSAPRLPRPPADAERRGDSPPVRRTRPTRMGGRNPASRGTKVSRLAVVLSVRASSVVVPARHGKQSPECEDAAPMQFILAHWPLTLVCIVMIVAAIIDGWKLKVPNWLTFPLVISGWLLGLAHNFGWLEGTGVGGIGSALAGTAVG